MEIYRQLTDERKLALDAAATDMDRMYEVLFAPPSERARVIQEQARLALGMAAHVDIASVQEPQKTELLYAMSSLRNSVPSDSLWL